MGVTPPNSSRRKGDGFPTAQLFYLAICRVAEPIALTSVFPYAFPLVLRFNFGDPDNASFYAGLLISAFPIAECTTGMLWGGLSDRIGRKPTLLLGCIGTMISLIMIGFASNFWIALLGRSLAGFLNGNVGVIQTMVGEMVKKPEHEPRAYSVMPFVWSIGTIIGPAIGGTFAEPAVGFPGLFSANGIFATFPYLLPNLICAGLLLISIVVGYLFLEETHPDMLAAGKSTTDHISSIEESNEAALLSSNGLLGQAVVDLPQNTYGTFNNNDDSSSDRWEVESEDTIAAQPTAPERPKMFTKRVVLLVVALGIFSYHAMAYDHLLPVFLQDERRDDISSFSFSPFHVPGGLGLTTQSVGFILSIDGIIAIAIQGFIFPIVTEILGVWKVFMLVTLLSPITYIFVPYLVFLRGFWLYVGIYACLILRNIFGNLAYPVILIMLKEASPAPSVLGRINGFAASVAAGTRSLAPPIAGYFYGVGINLAFTGIAWWVSGAVAVLGALQALMIRQTKRRDVLDGFPAEPVLLPPDDDMKSESILITCEESDEV
ncbi:MFS multidrug transporter-like protein [Xylona heveae TC161]|uniref:MFS multidrug transporter-like protein n=1 Tax=Xylona heveae (strain CBS 132557 / TC161) TaxID=1328760 RepID=A0A165H293_XYLHT|nr:MFS multidrug transporter-like protein [Xylona heveae TC161]KZF22889.1 MFS multidrug transporter-like protein [Xylona heveae TC161]